MTPQEAADLAARIGARIPEHLDNGVHRPAKCHECMNRQRIASDLAGIEQHGGDHQCIGGSGARVWSFDCPDAARYTANLVRTAALYGVAP